MSLHELQNHRITEYQPVFGFELSSTVTIVTEANYSDRHHWLSNGSAQANGGWRSEQLQTVITLWINEDLSGG